MSASILFTLLASVGMLHLEISPDNRAFYSASYEQYSTLLEFEDQFEVNSVVAFAITSEVALFDSAQFRESLKWLEKESNNLRNFVRSSSLASVPQVISRDDDLAIDNVLDVVCPDDCLSSRRDMILKPSHVGRLISSDARTAIVYSVVDVDPKVASEVTETFLSIEEVVSLFQQRYPELAIEITGAVPMMQSFLDTATEDSSTVVAIAFLVIFILLSVSLGSFRTAGLIFLTGAMSAAATVGTAGWFGLTLNTATAVVPIIIFTLVVAGAMHLVFHYLQRLEDQSKDQSSNLEATYRAQCVPMFLAALTSAVSLLSLVFVTSPPIKQLGILSALGVFLGFLLSYCFLGLLLPKVVSVPKWGGYRLIRRQINALARWCESGSPYGWLFFCGFLLFGIGVAQLKIDDDFIRYFDQDVPFRQAVEGMIAKEVGSPYHIEVIVSVEGEENVLSPEILSYVKSLVSELRSNPYVLNATSVVEVLEEVAQAMDLSEVVPTQSMANQLFLAFELGLPTRQTSIGFIDAAKKSLRVSVLLSDITSNQTRELEDWIYEFHSSNAPPRAITMVTGENIPVAHLSRKNILEAIQGLAPILILAAAILALVAQKKRFFLVGLVSILLPIAAGFGIWGWFVGEIGLAAAIILAATLGVVIDDTIHMVYRFEDGVRELSLSRLEAASYAIYKSGPAVATTSLCLCVGFLLMFLSSYAVNQVFGIAACLIFGLAMVFDLIVLPKLLAYPQVKKAF